MYHDFVAPNLHSNLLTETWQHGTTIGPSCDGDYTVLDIIKLDVRLPVQNFSFVNYDDHSKFVVANKSGEPFVCIGDINREVRILRNHFLKFIRIICPPYRIEHWDHSTVT